MKEEFVYRSDRIVPVTDNWNLQICIFMKFVKYYLKGSGVWSTLLFSFIHAQSWVVLSKVEIWCKVTSELYKLDITLFCKYHWYSTNELINFIILQRIQHSSLHIKTWTLMHFKLLSEYTGMRNYMYILKLQLVIE